VSTIHDVAKHAGVSTATVSRVLNGNPKVDPLMRQRVIEAVEELRYIPNGTARSLVTKQTRRVALLISDITNSFFAETARGAQDTLDERGYQLLLANSDDQSSRELRSLATFAETGVDGVLIEPAMPSNQSDATQRANRNKLSRQLEALGVPVVGFGPDRVTDTADIVTIDEEQAGFKAVDHLLGLGHQRIAMINGPAHSAVGSRRAAGYRQALARNGVVFDPELLISANFRRDAGFEAMRMILEWTNCPSAVFAGDDLIAIGALQALKNAGLRVPQDVAIVCIGDAARTIDTDPALTSVVVPRGYELGRVGSQLLLERIIAGDKEPLSPRKVVLETRLVVRTSTVAGLALNFDLNR
jgi:LacI family transcriptional regulator